MTSPRIQIRLDHADAKFMPGDVLVCEYEIEMADKQVSAVESSVIWTTSGKGEEDCGVHFFERRPKSTLDAEQLRRPHRISTVLPRSPLSYEGAIVQIHWSVRLRVFLGSQQFTEDKFFQLGETLPASIADEELEQPPT